MIACDVCLNTEVTDFKLTDSGNAVVGYWDLCEECADALVSTDWSTLITRSVQRDVNVQVQQGIEYFTTTLVPNVRNFVVDKVLRAYGKEDPTVEDQQDD